METTSVRKRQSMAPSSIVIQHTPAGTTSGRMAFGPGGTGSMIMRSNVMSSYTAPIIRPLGETAKVSKESVQNVMSTRGIEKRELGDLNSKLADYIDKVKYMEACNKAMTEEIEKLRKMKGYTQDRVREEYEDELKEARETIAQLSKELAPLQAKNLELEDKLDTKDQEINALRKQREELSNQINKMTQMCGDLEGECATLRMRLESLGKENEMLKSDIQRVRDDNDRIRHDFEVAVAKQIDCQNQVEALTEELQFTNDAYRAELEELTNLLANYKSIQPNMEKLWKSEFKECIQAIQAEYNDQLARMTAEQQRRCDEQIASMQMGLRRDNTDAEIIKSESKTLKSAMGETKKSLANLERENAGLRAELAALKNKYDEECEEYEQEKAELRQRILDLETEISQTIANLNELQNTNLDLRLEIECYRKLLEGEENSMKRLIEDQGRVQSAGGAMLAGLISGGVQSSQTSTMSESSGLVRVSRSSKCAISIAEIAQDGSMVRLENGSDNKDFDLSTWTVERKHSKGTSSYSFPYSFKLGAKKSIKIFSSGFADHAGRDDIVASKEMCKTWGTGDGLFKLMDETSTEKANATIEFTKR